MGWNDHVEFIMTECLDCGEVERWECWSSIGRQRYAAGGEIAEFLGVSAANHGKCPHCGSTRGEVVEDYEC